MKTILVLLAVAAAGSAALPAAPSNFRAVNVDTNIQIGYGVAAADIDGDKKPDILLADKNQIVWYQNPSWQKHIIAENLTKQDHVCIAAADIDGDGKAEIAAGAGWNPSDTLNSGSVHYLVAPADRTKKWEAVTLPHEPTVHRMRWVQGPDGSHWLVVVPLHGRGNKGGSGAGVKILAYKKPADPRQPWETRLLDESLHMTHNFDPVQWDDDRSQELLIGAKEGLFVLNRIEDNLKLVQLGGSEGGGAGEVRLGKLSEQGRFIATVEPMHGNALVVYTPASGGADKTPWERQVVDSSLLDGHALACGDLLGIGSDQIVVGWRAMGKAGAKVGIKLFTAQDKAGKEWKSALVDDNTMACEDLCLADLDGDGALDIIAAGRGTKNVKIYFNQSRKNK